MSALDTEPMGVVANLHARMFQKLVMHVGKTYIAYMYLAVRHYFKPYAKWGGWDRRVILILWFVSKLNGLRKCLMLEIWYDF